ncbi:hypothetical protein P376_5226 [Streptomyces sp. HCCB10043]|nr:hypothetical protein P376_5226 [Streptomyces sp. HCCB10043]
MDRSPRRIEAPPVVHHVQRHRGVHEAQGDLRPPGLRVAHRVGQRRLRGPQQRHLVRGRQLHRGAADREPYGQLRGGRPGTEPLQRGGQRPVLQIRRGQRPHEGARLGQIGLRRLTGGPDMRGRRSVLGQRAFGGAQQQLDAGQPLGQRVVDLPRQAFALGECPGGTFRLGEVRPGGDQLHDQLPPPFALPEEGVVPEDRGDGDRRADQRPDESAGFDLLPVHDEAGDRGGRGDHDGGQRPAHRQEVQLEEVEREGDPQGVRRQHQQRRPQHPQPAQPPRPRPRSRLHGGSRPCGALRLCGLLRLYGVFRLYGGGAHRPRRVQTRRQHRHDHDRRRVRRALAHRADHHQGQQPRQQRVQTEPQGSGDVGVRSRIHGSSSVAAGTPHPVNRKVDPGPVRRAMFSRPRRTTLGPCSSHGETFASPRAGSRSWVRSWC